MTEDEIRQIASRPLTSYQEAGETLDAALELIDSLRACDPREPLAEALEL